MWRPLAALLLVWIGCSGCGDSRPVDPRTQGEQVYRANCIVCHHPDPREIGAVGPPIAGSSRELLAARILRAEYPQGYTPKRDSHLMPPLPYLEKDIDALAAYLGSLDAPSQ